MESFAKASLICLVLLLNDLTVETAVDMKASISIIEDVFRKHANGKTLMPKRLHLSVEGMKGGLRIMPAALLDKRAVGFKTISGQPGSRRLGSTYFLMVLFDPDDGSLLSIMAADAITRLRTGAASGVATKYLARADSQTLGLYGAGVQARTQLEGVASVRSIRKVEVYDISKERLEIFRKQMSARLGIDITTTCEASEPASADIVVTATTSDKPFLMSHWVHAGTHINAMGANAPTKSEIDPGLMKRAKIFVDFKEQVLAEAGDIIAAIKSGELKETGISAELGELVTGAKEGRSNAEEITLFKSVGVAIEDLALALEVYERARKMGIGREVTL
ncbi:MAG: ornithine cyclodeaminase family protein [Nitrososphaerales archaeon]